MSKFNKSSIKNQITDIIEHFVKKEVIEESFHSSTFWSRESFMARSLIKKYGYDNLIFLDLGFKVNSLLFFRSFDGIKKLNNLINRNSGNIVTN
jgi:hypothetical protein